MSNSLLIILLIGLGVLTDATNINLANNSTILLLLLFLLMDEDSGSTCGCSTNRSCSGF